MRSMSELDELQALVSEALEIRETAEEKQRRLRHLEREILTSDLSTAERRTLVGRLYASEYAECMHGGR
jgi:uncharacterized coiled-coil DUF342 family protein